MTEEGAASVGSCCNHRNGWKRKRKWQKIECGFAEPCSPAAALSFPYQRERTHETKDRVQGKYTSESEDYKRQKQRD